MREGSFYRGEYKEEEVRGSDVARGQSRPIGGAGASIKERGTIRTEDRHSHVHL